MGQTHFTHLSTYWSIVIMADAEAPAAEAAPAKAPKATKAAKAPKAKKAAAKKPAAHPPYAAMITAAIKGLADKKGSSRQAILKYVIANNKVDAAKAGVRVKLALKKMVAAKKIVAAAAAGKKGAGSFKLPAKEPKAKNPRLKRQRSLRLKRPLSPKLPRSLQQRSQLPRKQPSPRPPRRLLLRRS